MFLLCFCLLKKIKERGERESTKSHINFYSLSINLELRCLVGNKLNDPFYACSIVMRW